MCGFDCKIKSSKKNDGGVKNFVTISCSRAQKANSSVSNPLNLPPTIRTDYKAAIHISLKLGKWSINSVKLNHNHEMDLVAARYLKCNRTLSLHVQREIELNKEVGIIMNITISSCSIKANGP
ncbi:hypothetical protein Dimus_024938 [Dionaea muscipula]